MNSFLPYDRLKDPNVLGTLSMLEFASGRSFHYVSTVVRDHVVLT